MYIAMHVLYDFNGDDSCRDAALDAVNLSQEKYCGVSLMLKKALPVTWEVNYNTVPIFNNRNVEQKLAKSNRQSTSVIFK